MIPNCLSKLHRRKIVRLGLTLINFAKHISQNNAMSGQIDLFRNDIICRKLNVILKLK